MGQKEKFLYSYYSKKRITLLERIGGCKKSLSKKLRDFIAPEFCNIMTKSNHVHVSVSGIPYCGLSRCNPGVIPAFVFASFQASDIRWKLFPRRQGIYDVA
jgi:hypothetical protein